MSSEPTALDRLKARYKAAATRPAEHLEVPVRRAAAGDLVVVYREPEWLETQEARIRWLRSDDERAPLNGQAELLAKACVDIKLRDGTGWLDGMGLGQGPVSFHAAAVALELPIGVVPEQQPLTAVFAVLGSDWEVERHGERITSWEVEEQLVGESEPAG
jgi:hypothetical protein